MRPTREPTMAAEFGARLRQLRRARKLTQQAVADRLQVHRTTYTKYETEGVTPDPQGLARLAEILGVSLDHLLGRIDEEPLGPAMAQQDVRAMTLTAQERELIQLFRRMTADQQCEVAARVKTVFYEKNGK